MMTERRNHLREERSSLTINDGVLVSSSGSAVFGKDELDILRDAGIGYVPSPSIGTEKSSAVDANHNKSCATAVTIDDDTWRLESGEASWTSSLFMRPEEEDNEDEEEDGQNNNDNNASFQSIYSDGILYNDLDHNQLGSSSLHQSLYPVLPPDDSHGRDPAAAGTTATSLSSSTSSSLAATAPEDCRSHEPRLHGDDAVACAAIENELPLPLPFENQELERETLGVLAGDGSSREHDNDEGGLLVGGPAEADANASSDTAAADSPPCSLATTNCASDSNDREEGGRRQAMRRRGGIMSQQRQRPDDVLRPGAYPVHGVDPRYGRRGGPQRILGATAPLVTRLSRAFTPPSTRLSSTGLSRGSIVAPPLLRIPSCLVGTHCPKVVVVSTSVTPCAVPVKYDNVADQAEEETGSEDRHDVCQRQQRGAEPCATSRRSRRAQAASEENALVVRSENAMISVETTANSSKVRSKRGILRRLGLSKMKKNSSPCGGGVVSRPEQTAAFVAR